MLGAIAGDIIGSQFSCESLNIRTKSFELFTEECSFTDDTVCTVAIADALLHGRDYAESLRDWGERYPHRGYGALFWGWLNDPAKLPYESYGNGAAMRVSPVGYLFAHDEELACDVAEQTSTISHNHPEAVRSVRALTSAIVQALGGKTAQAIMRSIEHRYGYAMWETVSDLRRGMTYSTEAKLTVPPSLICALKARDFEDAIRNAVSIGGDTDTIACVAGALAEAIFDIPNAIESRTMCFLPHEMQEVVWKFYSRIAAR